MTRWQRNTAIGLLGLVLPMLPLCAVAQEALRLYLAGESGPFKADFRQALRQRLPVVQWVSAAEQAEVVVAIGDGAFSRALEQGTPVLGVHISRPLSERQPGHCRCTAVWAGVPLQAQLEVIRTMMPRARRLGVVLGPNSAWSEQMVKHDHDKLEIRALPAANSATLGQVLREQLAHLDALLLPADDSLFDPGAAKLVLLTSYRQRTPVFGPNLAFVKAGSAASRYPSGTDLVAAASRRLEAFLENGQWPAAGFVGGYAVAVNEHVAGSFNLRYRDSQRLQQALEGNP